MRRLNRQMLAIIDATQKCFAFHNANESVLGTLDGRPTSALEEARRYYKNLPDPLMNLAGLAKSEDDFSLVLRFDVTPAMRLTAFEQLDGFVFDALAA